LRGREARQEAFQNWHQGEIYSRPWGLTIDFRFALAAPPDQIGLQPDDRKAAARLAALNTLQKKGVFLAFRELQECGYGRFQIRDKLRVENLRSTGIINAREF